MSGRRQKIERFFGARAFAVAGASADRSKFGNKVLRAYLRHGRTVHPINPRLDEVEGVAAYPDVTALSDGVEAISIVTPPSVTLEVVRAALARGIDRLWMQPGAEHAGAVAIAEEAGALVIHGGPCLLNEIDFF